MIDFENYNPNTVSNPNNNIFGMPTNEENADLVILPVPWEVTVSYGVGTARAPEAIHRASLQVDVFDPDVPDAWKRGYFMRMPDKKVLLKSDYLRKEAELFIDYIAEGDAISDNQFMEKTLKDVNDGGVFLNNWVYEQTKELLDKGKMVAVLGGDHSTPLGFMKAIGEKYGNYGILQIDAHADLRICYEGFVYSHASIMYNALSEVPEIERLVQVGVRDYGGDEWDYIKNSNYRVVTYFDREIKLRKYDGETWSHLTDEIVNKLPQNVYVSFDIDGLDRKLCPFTGTPVPGGFELEEVTYLIRKMVDSGRKIIGFDLCEVGVSENEWNENVGARVLMKLCNLMVKSQSNE